MNSLIKYLFFGFVFITGVSLYSQNEKKLIREGNDLFEEGNYSEAEIEYRKSLTEKPGYYKGTFNLGDAMYKQENFEESGKLFNEVAEISNESDVKASAFYNLGNTFLSEDKFKEGIEAYKKSLRLNPDDVDAKYNLEYARKKLNEQQQQQQNQDQNKDKDQDKKDKDKDQDKKDKNKKDQDKKDQDKKDQKDKKDQDKKDQNKDGDQNKDQQQQPQPQQISKQDAQRMLEALKNDEKKTLQKLQIQKAKAAKSSKTEIDW